MNAALADWLKTHPADELAVWGLIHAVMIANKLAWNKAGRANRGPAHSNRVPYFTGNSLCPPNPNRIAESIRSGNAPASRDLKRV